MVRFGVPGQNVDTLAYADGRLSTVPVVQAPREPLTSDKKYPMWCEWRIKKNPSTGTEGDFWKLVKFESNGDANWVKFSPGGGGSGDMNGLRDQVNADVDPNGATGRIDIDGLVVASNANPSSIPLETVAGTETLTIQLQVGKARAGAPGNKNDAGIVSFDTTQFGVDTDGYVTLAGSGGGAPILKIKADDGNTQSPDGTGELTFSGNVVANAANAKPLYTDGGTSNEIKYEIQVGTERTGAPADKNDAGIVSFSDAEFAVDANGYTTLVNPYNPNNLTYGKIENLAISYSSPTTTIHAADGTALSASNPGYVTLYSATNAYQLVRYSITQNYTFDDRNGTSDIAGNQFGYTPATATVDISRPIFIYFVANDAETAVTPCLSAVPQRSTAPAAAYFGKPSSAIADDVYSFWAWDDSITVGDYDSNPCLLVGCIDLQKPGATVDWGVVGLYPLGSYIWERNQYAFNGLAMGATTSRWSSSNGGDTIFTENTTFGAYSINRAGEVYYRYNFGNINVSGSGTGNLRLHTPYLIANGDFIDGMNGNGIVYNVAGANYTGLIPFEASTYSATGYLSYVNLIQSTTATALLTPASITTNQRNLGVTVRFSVPWYG